MSKKCHEICFRNVPNDWDSALPVGNGKLGAMVFFRDHVLHIALNQYDCYYQVLGHLYGEKDESGETFQDPARFTETYENLCRRVDEFREKGDTSRNHYTRMLHPANGGGRPSYRGASYPVGGELLLTLDEAVSVEQSCLKLRIEEAEITFEAGCKDAKVTASMIASREKDGILVNFSQSRRGLWKEGKFVIPSMNGQEEVHQEILTEPENENRGLVMRQYRGGFCQELALIIEGNPAESDFVEKKSAQIKERLNLKDMGCVFAAAVSLQPEKSFGYHTVKALLDEKNDAVRSHKAYWEKFWCSSITIPDKFLERLWHLHLYMMECSSGEGSSYPEQSWGLSGLWDIRRPNMWGSMWYWDVNIQSAFWGSYSAGHPEFLKLFCEGYLAYTDDIHAYTRHVYGKEGWALDYPHTLYNCIQPWCTQFLWKYFEYTGDLEFLEKKAYPVFREQTAFFQELAVKDEAGIYHIEYDVSPEQGPVTKDSVITISCVRRLLEMAVEAADILKRPFEEKEEMLAMLGGLPAYPKTAEGDRFKDSALVQDNVFLRHPSVLMPIFPAEEIERKIPYGEAGEGAARNAEEEGTARNAEEEGTARNAEEESAARNAEEKSVSCNREEKTASCDAERENASPEQERRCWEETLRYAAEHTETGTFGMGWLAAAAARLGYGKTALRLLYEKGIDYVIHTNGLAYEESERFLNYCHITKPAHSLPAMMESSGGIVNAVNMMLLQKGTDGALQIFPAVPEEADILEEAVQYREDQAFLEGRYEIWKDCSFRGLMAPGGFRISAKREDGKAVFLEVESTVNAVLKIRIPGELTVDGNAFVQEAAMKAGEVLRWGKKGTRPEAPGDRSDAAKEQRKASGCGTDADAIQPEVLCHEAAGTHRRVFLGADSDTAYCQAVDGFTCAFLMGNELQYKRTPYIFDFGCEDLKKNYDDAYPAQFVVSGQGILYTGGPRKVGVNTWDSHLRFGFTEKENLSAADRGGPDDLRRDFLEGSGEAIFSLYLPKGKYDLLIISGDEEEESASVFDLPDYGSFAETGNLKKGRYASKVLSALTERDGELRVRVRPGKSGKWKLNAMFINKSNFF